MKRSISNLNKQMAGRGLFKRTVSAFEDVADPNQQQMGLDPNAIENDATNIPSDSAPETDPLAGGGGSEGEFLTGLLESHVSLHLLHWNATSFSQHEALGEAYGKLDDLIDNFVETYIGAKSRDLLKTVSSLSVSADGDPTTVLDKLEDIFRNQIQGDIGDQETALLNIRDEMLGLVQHTRYLLTLK